MSDTPTQCPECDGEGYIHPNSKWTALICPDCAGSGRPPDGDTVEVQALVESIRSWQTLALGAQDKAIAYDRIMGTFMGGDAEDVYRAVLDEVQRLAIAELDRRAAMEREASL
jgi:DnaJ-class molecular chaperone